MASPDILQKIKQAETTRKLDLSNSRFSDDLPQELFALKNLRSLNLYRNQLKQLPEQLRELDMLTELNLYRNLLTSLPLGISLLKSPTVLNLGSNRFSEIPAELYKLESLEELDLSNNSITSISPSISNLGQLRDLKLFRNKLTSLPHEMGNLKNLKKLDLNHNVLTTLPSGMGKLSSLIVLEVADNPLSSPPIYICNRGCLAIVNYLKEQMQDETTPSKCTARGDGLSKAKANEKSTFIIESRNANGEERVEGGDNFVVKIVGPSNVSIAPKIEDLQDGSYEVEYVPITSGAYSIDVTLDGKHISQSPFFLQVEPGPILAAACTASGGGMLGGINERECVFTIESKDKNGNQVAVGGAKFKVDITGVGNISATVTDQSNGRYEVKYTPKQSGNYSIAVTHNGAHIVGSPFTAVVMNSSAADMSKEEVKVIHQQIENEIKAREALEQANRELEAKVAKLKQKMKKKKVDYQVLESELQKTREELSSVNQEFAALKKEKEQFESEAKMTEEIKQWKKQLEDKLSETTKQLEAEAETRAVLEKVLSQMKHELEEEVKARTDLEDLKKGLESEVLELKKKVSEIDDLKATLEEELIVRNEWKAQLELEQQQLMKQLQEGGNKAELEQKLSDVKKELDEEKKARVDLEASKKMVEAEAAELRQMLLDVEESIVRLDFETKNAQEIDVWKSKMEQEARLRIRMEKLKEKLEVETMQVKRRLEIEATSRKLLEARLSEAQSKPKQTDVSEVEQLRKLIENESKSRAELDSQKKHLEHELEALKRQLEKIRPSSAEGVPPMSPKEKKGSIKRDRSGSLRGAVRNMREELDPAKLSFKEKLGFWSTLKV